MSWRTGTGPIRVTAVIRAGWAGALLLAPERLLAAAGSGSPAAVATARVLGVRHLLQAVASGVAPNAPVAGAGALIDTLHTVSCLGLAAVVPAARRAALLDAAIESGFALSGWSSTRVRKTRGARAG
jgi:hypothetical protein